MDVEGWETEFITMNFLQTQQKWGNIVCIINGREKLFSNTTDVLSARTEWDKVTATVGEFTGHLQALCIVFYLPEQIGEVSAEGQVSWPLQC